MNDDVRCLFRPGVEPPGRGGGAPSGAGRMQQEARRELGDYLDAVLMRPLNATDHDRSQQIETSLDSMTPAERVYLEIEMQGRKGSLYTADYDALR